MWAGLSSSQVVLGAIRIYVGAEGDLSKDSFAHSHSSAEPFPCCCTGVGEMPSCSGNGAAGRAQCISVKPKRVPKIRQRGLMPMNLGESSSRHLLLCALWTIPRYREGEHHFHGDARGSSCRTMEPQTGKAELQQWRAAGSRFLPSVGLKLYEKMGQSKAELSYSL